MIKINLIKQARKGVSQKEIAVYKQMLVGGIVIAVVIGIMAFMELGIHNKIADTRADIEQLNQKLAELNKVVEQIKNLKTMRSQIKAKLNIIDNLEKNRISEVHLMDELSKSIPYHPGDVISKKLWLVSMQQQGGVISMDGIALNNNAIAEFMNNLSSDQQYFSQVNLSRTEEIKSNDVLLYKFSLTCKFNAVPGKSTAKAGNESIP